MSFQKVQSLLKSLPASTLDTTRITFTEAHQDYLALLQLNPGHYSLNRIVSNWNQLIAAYPHPENSPEIEDASHLFFLLIARVYHSSGIRDVYVNGSPENFQIILEEFSVNSSNQPPISLLPRHLQHRKHRRLLILFAVFTLGVGLNLLVWIPTWLKSIHHSPIYQEKQN